MDKQTLEKIIEAANLAPSGGNSQPWAFEVANNVLRVKIFPERDHRIYNFKNRATYIAHGALLENVSIAAARFGYGARATVFPMPGYSAEVVFEPSENKPQGALYDAIERRHSNRKRFNTAPLSAEQKRYLFEDAESFSPCIVKYLEGPAVQEAARQTALDVVIALGNRMLHEMLFHEVLWRKEDQRERGGLYIKTMEMAPPKSILFGLMKHWPVVQFFKKRGMLEKIYAENSKTGGSAALLGTLVVPDDDRAFVQAGRLLQNIWLRATKLGLNMNLMMSVAFLWQHANLGEENVLSKEETEKINGAYARLKELFGVTEGILGAVFRVGEAPPPLDVSFKRPPVIEWK